MSRYYDGMDSALSQITERVRAAIADKTALRLRGGGSKDFHALSLPGELLDTRPLQGIVSYEPSELVVTVRAGTSLAELQSLLAENGQCLAFDPPHFTAGPPQGEMNPSRRGSGYAPASERGESDFTAGPPQGEMNPSRRGSGYAPASERGESYFCNGSTVGGMVAAGLSGPARASVGAVRDYVLGIEILNGRAELLRFGGQVMKNVAGYDVSRLMAGSWGTLGLVTEVSLKVLPVAPAEATLRFACTQGQALQWLNRWGGQPLPLNASCWLEEAGQGILYLRLRGAKAAVQAACQQLGGELLEDVAANWDACRDHQLPWFVDRLARPELALWRLSVPAKTPPLDLPAGALDPLIEWHGALRWVQAPRSLGPALQALAREVGGSAQMFCAERDAPLVAAATDASGQPALAALQARVQNAFDPAGIFNPGRMQPLA